MIKICSKCGGPIGWKQSCVELDGAEVVRFVPLSVVEYEPDIAARCLPGQCYLCSVPEAERILDSIERVRQTTHWKLIPPAVRRFADVADLAQERLDWKHHAKRADEQVRRDNPALNVDERADRVAGILKMQGIRGRGGKELTAATIKRDCLRASS